MYEFIQIDHAPFVFISFHHHVLSSHSFHSCWQRLETLWRGHLLYRKSICEKVSKVMHFPSHLHSAELEVILSYQKVMVGFDLCKFSFNVDTTQADRHTSYISLIQVSHKACEIFPLKAGFRISLLFVTDTLIWERAPTLENFWSWFMKEQEAVPWARLWSFGTWASDEYVWPPSDHTQKPYDGLSLSAFHSSAFLPPLTQESFPQDHAMDGLKLI